MKGFVFYIICRFSLSGENAGLGKLKIILQLSFDLIKPFDCYFIHFLHD